MFVGSSGKESAPVHYGTGRTILVGKVTPFAYPYGSGVFRVPMPSCPQLFAPQQSISLPLDSIAQE